MPLRFFRRFKIAPGLRINPYKLRIRLWLSLVALVCNSTPAATLAERAKESGCTSAPEQVAGSTFKCVTQSGYTAYFPFPGHADGPDPTEVRFQTAFAKVKIGMTIDQVQRIGQVGNGCTDWPHQGPPTCGPLRYFSDKHTVETASGTTVTYDWGGGQRIVFKNGVVVLISR